MGDTDRSMPATSIHMGKTTQNLLQRLRGRPRRRDVKRPAAAPENAPAETRPATDALAAGFSSELFASLLLELPEHRRAFTTAWLASDHASLAASAHRLAGAGGRLHDARGAAPRALAGSRA